MTKSYFLPSEGEVSCFSVVSCWSIRREPREFKRKWHAWQWIMLQYDDRNEHSVPLILKLVLLHSTFNFILKFLWGTVQLHSMGVVSDKSRTRNNACLTSHTFLSVPWRYWFYNGGRTLTSFSPTWAADHLALKVWCLTSPWCRGFCFS